MRSYSSLVVVFAIAAMAIIGPSFAQADTALYSANDDFSITNGNPNGVWSYGYRSASGASSFSAALYADTTTHPNNAGCITWSDTHGDPNILYNPTTTNFGSPDVWGGWYANAGAIVLNPAALEYRTTPQMGVRWTAPEAGTIVIANTFSPSQTANYGLPAYVYRGGSLGDVKLWTSTGVVDEVSGPQSYTSVPLAVSAGDTIDFVVDGSTSGTTKSIALAAEISFTAVPEPSTITLLVVSGLVGLLAYAWRKRK
jgi:hypothetical protein